MKILYVANMNKDSGVACFLMNYFRNMDAVRLKIDFLCWDKREKNFYKEIEELGGKVILIPSYKKNPFAFLSAIRKTLRDGQYDLVHGHEAIMNLPFFFFARLYGVENIVAHSHNSSMPSAPKDFIVKVCRIFFGALCTEFMACSQNSGEYLFGKKRFARRGHVVNNAIPLERFAYQEEIRKRYRSELGISGRFVLGHVGRFNFQKNHKYLIEVFRYYKKLDSKAVLLLVGDGETRTEISEKVQEYGLQDDVYFLGIRSDVAELMQAMDCFVLPSLYEGLAVVLIEAQTAGLPCYVSTGAEEACCCKNSVSMSLNLSPQKWAKTIYEDKNRTIMRSEGIERVRNCGYDIKIEAEKLQNYYLGMGRLKKNDMN